MENFMLALGKLVLVTEPVCSWRTDYKLATLFADAHEVVRITSQFTQLCRLRDGYSCRYRLKDGKACNGSFGRILPIDSRSILLYNDVDRQCIDKLIDRFDPDKPNESTLTIWSEPYDHGCGADDNRRYWSHKRLEWTPKVGLHFKLLADCGFKNASKWQPSNTELLASHFLKEFDGDGIALLRYGRHYKGLAIDIGGFTLGNRSYEKVEKQFERERYVITSKTGYWIIDPSTVVAKHYNALRYDAKSSYGAVTFIGGRRLTNKRIKHIEYI